MSHPPIPLLIGEIIVDFTITSAGTENKMRLGGITHAARAFWALGAKFSAAAILPQYLEKSARKYFKELGCQDFIVMGYVDGAPNVTLIFDAIELADQGYEAVLRDEKTIHLQEQDKKTFLSYEDALIFPGSYNLATILQLLPSTVRCHLDVAYDVESVDALKRLNANIKTILISTSSKLFNMTGQTGIDELASNFSSLGLDTIILKENRGGSRLYTYVDQKTELIPAQLGSTLNSVGVGDAFAASYLTHLKKGSLEAVWRATSASSAYAQTTEPDRFLDYVRRDLKLTLQELQELGGVSLPWEKRQIKQIYLASPDFQNSDRTAIERVLSSLQYHNFKVRRPVKENGELPLDSDIPTLKETYQKDVDLLRECQMVFAVPTNKDPGTLVEIGLAIEMGIPVVVYDPLRECANTMVIAGSVHYSDDLDSCLNATFTALRER